MCRIIPVPAYHHARTVFLLCVVISILTILNSIGEQSREHILFHEHHQAAEADVLMDAPSDFDPRPLAPAIIKNDTTTVIQRQRQPQQQKYELCFVTSVFAADLESADIVGNVTQHRLQNPTFHYIVFTNRQDLKAPGWTPVVLNHKNDDDLPYQRLITQSRFGKFVPWQHEETARTCPIIFYLDGYTLPINTPRAANLFRDAAQRIRANKFGLGQYPKRGSRISRLAQGLVDEGKDTAANINITLTWLHAQPDFRPSCKVYLNRHIGLDPHNANYQKLSSYFWELYRREEGSWRDQLLWSYAVDKFKARPVNLYDKVAPMKKLFKERRDRMGYNGHTYVDVTGKNEDNSSVAWGANNSIAETSPEIVHRPTTTTTTTTAVTKPTTEVVLDFIPLENTRTAVLATKNVTTARRVSMGTPLFHLIHTTDEEDFGRMQKRCLESIFFHHPNAKVLLHTKHINSTTPVQYLIDAGYDISVQPYDPVVSLQRLQKESPGVVSDKKLQKFMQRVDGYASDPEGNWYSNESNLLRMILMYLEGGSYLDTDTIVVKPMDTLPPNIIGYQNRQRTSLNGAVLHQFEPRNDYIKACLKEFLTHFKNRLWGANGPRLLTRVYSSKPPAQWTNVQPVDPYFFQYFSYHNIRKDCYEDLRDYKVLQRMNGIRENSYVVHTNNHVGGTILDGSVCDCLYNTFCLSTDCQKMEHCENLLEKPEQQRIVTGVEYLDGLETTNMLSIPLNEYGPRKNIGTPNDESALLKMYVYDDERANGHNRSRQADTALTNLFKTYPGRTNVPSEADVFVVPSSYLNTDAIIAKITNSSSCSNSTPGGMQCVSGRVENATTALSALLPFYKENNAAKHLFVIPESSSDRADLQLFENSLTLSVGSMKKPTTSVDVPTFNPHPALQPSAIQSRPMEWWTKARQYSFTARDVSVDKFDRSLTSHAFLKHVKGWKSVGNLPFALIDPNEVDNTESLMFFQESIFCPCFFDDDGETSLKWFFDVILSGCIPVLPRYEKQGSASSLQFLPFSSRTNYSEFVLEVDASRVSKGSVVQAIKDTLKKDHTADLQRRQEKLRDFAVSVSYGLGLDAHTYADAFYHILGSVKERLTIK